MKRLSNEAMNDMRAIYVSEYRETLKSVRVPKGKMTAQTHGFEDGFRAALRLLTEPFLAGDENPFRAAELMNDKRDLQKLPLADVPASEPPV